MWILMQGFLIKHRRIEDVRKVRSVRKRRFVQRVQVCTVGGGVVN